MEYNRSVTSFASPERSTPEERTQQFQKLKESKVVSAFLNGLPNLLVILNPEREIVYANETIMKELGIKNPNSLFGQRPGEILDCIHASERESGCGTTEACEYCGAVNAILASQKGQADIRECRIIQKNSDDALDFRVWASPIKVEDDSFTIFMVTDISNEKRRRTLERIFFHDVLNTAGGLRGFADLLRDADPADMKMLSESIYHIADEIIDEISAQKDLMAAETNELKIKPSTFKSTDVLHEVFQMYRNHLVSEGKTIEVDPSAESVDVYTDHTLIRRVVGNMLKNAVEAVRVGAIVKLGCSVQNDDLEYWVWNGSYIPKETQLQIFQRSFSTKGLGRGLGTHSMRLITKRFLNGDVRFKSSEEEGTTFYAKIPLTVEPL